MKNPKIIRKLMIALLAVVLLFSTVTALGEETHRETKQGDFRTVGSIVTFGSYEQDNDLTNGPEPIEWVVLDVQGEKALLLSRFGLDAKQYHHLYEAITWENCSMRSWLNDEFLKTAFDEKEQAAILVTDVDNSPEQGYIDWIDVESGNNTQDKIFLLSCAEANRYLDVTPQDKNNLKARVAPTPYAVARGAWIHHKDKTADGTGAARWWLRSPGRYEYRAAHVIANGSLQNTHVSSASDHYGGGVARPALWLNLETWPN